MAVCRATPSLRLLARRSNRQMQPSLPQTSRTRIALAYLFTWRHSSSGILSNDKITVAVDDAGTLTTYTKQETIWSPHCMCYIKETVTYKSTPWIPAYHVSTYARVWRTLGAPLQTITPQITSPRYAYCASDMSSATSQATPCGVDSPSGTTTFRDLVTGRAVSSGI